MNARRLVPSPRPAPAARRIPVVAGALLVLALPLAPPLPAQAETAPLRRAAPALTMREAVSLAAERSPEAAAARAELDAARALAGQASRLLRDNPEVSLEAGPRMHSGKTTADFGVSASQPLELFGQRGARLDAARGSVRAAEARIAAVENELAYRVREAFLQALAARATRGLADEAVALARRSLSVAEERHAAGDAARLEVNAAQVEVGRAQAESLRAASRERQALGTLALLVGLESSAGLAIDGALPAEASAPPPLQTLRDEALSQRPELALARSNLEAARAEERLAGRLGLPRPSLGAAYRREESAQIVQGTLAFELPLFERNQAARNEARSRSARAQSELEAWQRRVAQEVELAASRLEAARTAAEALGGSTLQAAQESLQLFTEAARTGQVDPLQLALLRREALQVRREHAEALSELGAAAAELERALGRAAVPVVGP